MINSQNLINKICACISAGGLNALQTCQLNTALCILNAPVCSVPCFGNLPDPFSHAGRMIYVHAENQYYHAVDGYWVNNFGSTPFHYVDTTWSWGTGASGQLGNNTNIVSTESPVSVVGGIANWCQASAGSSFSVAVRTNGTTWSWGLNTSGQLGDNSLTNRSSPVSVSAGFTDWCQVNAGVCHTVAIRTGGSAWAWGINSQGRLGDGTVTASSSPVSVVGFSDWCQISAGGGHSLALRTGRTAWSWGCNNAGQLGTNSTTSRSSPVSVVGEFTDWCQISAGCVHSAGLRTGGTIWTWGCNNYGQLGDNTITTKSSPVSVVGGFNDWCQISAGGSHTVAIRTGGSAWAWGCNSTTGALGDGTVNNTSSPVSVVGGFTDWCQASAGRFHTMAVRFTASLWGWGNQCSGQLGNGGIGPAGSRVCSPLCVVGGFRDWCQVSAGALHTVAIRQVCKGF